MKICLVKYSLCIVYFLSQSKQIFLGVVKRKRDDDQKIQLETGRGYISIEKSGKNSYKSKKLLCRLINRLM